MNFEDRLLSKHLHDKNGDEISTIYIENFLSKILKIDKLHEKGLIITLFTLFMDIFSQNLMIKSHSSTDASPIYMLPTQKHYKFIKMLAVDGNT